MKFRPLIFKALIFKALIFKALISIAILAVACTLPATAQDHMLTKEVRRFVKHGNKLMHRGQREEARAEYRKAYKADSISPIVSYNLATSLFPNEWKTLNDSVRNEAISLLQAAAQGEENRIRRGMAWHNIGVAHHTAGQLQQAIEAYKQALRSNPNDNEARYNLVLCQRQLKDQPQQNDSTGNSQNQQQQQQEQQQEQQNQQQQQQQQQPEQQQPQNDNQDWIEQLLNAADQHEKQVRRRLDEQQGQPNRRQRNEKNW